MFLSSFLILCIHLAKLRARLALQPDTSPAHCPHTHCWSQGTRQLRHVFCSIIRHLQNSQGPSPGEYRTKPGSAHWSLSPHLISSEVLWLSSEQQQKEKEKSGNGLYKRKLQRQTQSLFLEPIIELATSTLFSTTWYAKLNKAAMGANTPNDSQTDRTSN